MLHKDPGGGCEGVEYLISLEIRKIRKEGRVNEVFGVDGSNPCP